MAEVSCILRHWGVQLILAYNWARPAILVADKSIGVMFLFLFLPFHSCSSFSTVPLSSPLLSLLSLLPFSGRQHKMTHMGWLVVKLNNQLISMITYMYVVGTNWKSLIEVLWKCLSEALLMSTKNKYLCGEIRKISVLFCQKNCKAVIIFCLLTE